MTTTNVDFHGDHFVEQREEFVKISPAIDESLPWSVGTCDAMVQQYRKYCYVVACCLCGKNIVVHNATWASCFAADVEIYYHGLTRHPDEYCKS